ncbi:MAG: hypothetical protein OCD76_04605 [Reichenbachiella sp.]
MSDQDQNKQAKRKFFIMMEVVIGAMIVGFLYFLLSVFMEN